MHAGAIITTFRPKFLILTPICILLGIATTYSAHGQIQVDHAVLVLLGALFAHASVNAFNEYLDFKSGLDLITQRTPFSGGTGTLPANPQAQGAVLGSAVATLCATLIIGVYLLIETSWKLLPIGLLGMVTIVAYTRQINRLPWVCLIAPGMAFGPLFVLGTYFSIVPGSAVSISGITVSFCASLVPFFLVNNLLLLNQFPDVEADKQVGRNTFPIAFGLPAALRVFGMFLFLTALVIILCVLAGLFYWFVLITLIPLFVLGINVQNGILRGGFETESMIPYLGKNVACVLVTTFVFAMSILLVEVI